MIRVEEVDPYDEGALRAFHDHVARVAAVQPYAVPLTFGELREAVRARAEWTDHLLLRALRDDGVTVATAHVEVPLRDNTETVWADLALDPEHREDAGVLLDDLKHRARLLGRSRVEAEARWLPDSDEGPDAALLRMHGFRRGIVEAQRVLDLPADLGALHALAKSAAPHHRDYTLRTWRGPVPEDVVEAYAQMRAMITSEAPSGDMEWEDEDFPPERVRAEEAEFAAQQRTSWTTVAVAAAGTVAGHTQIVIPRTDEVNAYQWDTIVVPAHRGHRLGLAMKVHNLSAAADDLRPRTLLHTWNAVENSPMVAVNEAMGFRLVVLVGAFRCDV